MSGRNIEDFFSDPEGVRRLERGRQGRLLAGESSRAKPTPTIPKAKPAKSQSSRRRNAESSATPAAAKSRGRKEGRSRTRRAWRRQEHDSAFPRLRRNGNGQGSLEQNWQRWKQAPAGSQEAGRNRRKRGAQAPATEQFRRSPHRRDEALYSDDTDRAHEISMKIIRHSRTPSPLRRR